MQTRTIEPGDTGVWARMREQLWPGQRAAHGQEIAAFLAATGATRRK